MICYVATHSDSGRRYVGITNDSLSLRRSSHESHAKKEVDDTFFHKAIRAYSVDDFSWKVVAEGDEEVIRLLENALIHTWANKLTLSKVLTPREGQRGLTSPHWHSSQKTIPISA